MESLLTGRDRGSLENDSDQIDRDNCVFGTGLSLISAVIEDTARYMVIERKCAYILWRMKMKEDGEGTKTRSSSLMVVAIDE